MKLLLDQNLSHRMLRELEAAFPGSTQVGRIGLDTADDKSIWQYAKDNGFAIVTQDSDFPELATLYGAPPKMFWLKCGNRPHWYVENLLSKYKSRINMFGQSDSASVLEVF